MHLRAWAAWLVSVLFVALSTRNPLYLTVVLLIALIVGSHGARLRNRPAVLWPARLAMVIIPFSGLFNALTVHIGDTVLFTIPGELPLLSGPITAEAVVYGSINGLSLTTVIAVFGVLSAAAPAHYLVRAAPRAFQSIGVTVGIALSFIPQTMRRLRDVREAQAVRGHTMRGLRDWLPVWVPVLMGGLEQSMQLAEAMVARGFGATQRRDVPARARLWVLTGLSLVLAGFLLSLSAANPFIGLAALAAGSALTVIGVWQSSRSSPHTSYRVIPFTPFDALCAGVSLAISALIALPFSPLAHETLSYTPYPTLSMPGFDPLIGVLMWGWLMPLLRRRLPCDN
ncbi:MAG: energy-coupling factor transporter transmembrane component T [Anaerolineae bacterium]|nr:energy-coupling factor transporter transmembrane protein EcfT [Thermoflexales bacterium]MDW8408111.1 energy-coupling factor transporter transmembrane component T [Anaerolineae bacterium]